MTAKIVILGSCIGDIDGVKGIGGGIRDENCDEDQSEE